MATSFKDFKLIHFFYSYLKPYRLLVNISLITIPFATGATILIPWLIVSIIDNYLVVGNSKGLFVMILFVAGAVVMGFISDGVYTYSLQKAGQLAITDMRRDLFCHTLTLPRTYFDKHPIGVTLSRLTSDIEAISESLAIGVLSLLTDLIKTIALLTFLFYLSWPLTLVVLLVFPVVYFVVTWLRKKLRKYYDSSREALADSSGFLQECLNGIKTIQLYSAEKKALQRFKSKNSRFAKAQMKSNIYDAVLYSLIEGLTTITLVLMIWYGTGQIITGFITIGVLIAFINTLNRIFIPIREFAQQIALIQRALAALEHIVDLFSQSPEEAISEKPINTSSLQSGFQELHCNDLTFTYNAGHSDVLKGINFSLNKGDQIAIVGATGSGKSTIFRLLTKAYRNYEGSIKLNGLELAEIPQKELLQMIILMQQDVFLFDETLAFNISLGRPGISDLDIQKAAEYVFADQFIQDLPGGYEFKIFGNGKNLSAGQAQLISFARAIVGKSELILLDEATASVDSVTESLIQKAIEKIFQEKTVIVIAHRLSTIRTSSRILVMKNGEIIEQGDHDSLVERNGYYVELLQKLDGNEAELNQKVA